jgi:hypothetical protein
MYLKGLGLWLLPLTTVSLTYAARCRRSGVGGEVWSAREPIMVRPMITTFLACMCHDV